LRSSISSPSLENTSSSELRAYPRTLRRRRMGGCGGVGSSSIGDGGIRVLEALEAASKVFSRREKLHKLTTYKSWRRMNIQYQTDRVKVVKSTEPLAVLLSDA